MKILLLLLVLAGCCVLQCSCNCSGECRYGILATQSAGGNSTRYGDSPQEAATRLSLLVAAGFSGVPAADACNNPAACGTNTTCTVNTTDVFICTCDTYFEAGGDNQTFVCSDIDECNLSTDNCSDNATCINESPLFSCTCFSGYTGDGVNCTDIKECDSHPCGLNATCDEPQVDNYTCTCVSGYTGDAYNGNCSDIDECSNNALNDCHDNATCANTDQSFTCTCIPGFTGDGKNCTDIDECASNPCHADATCSNNVDNYTCACNTGYSGDGYNTCVRARQDINITFIITCTSLSFHNNLTDNTSNLYINVTTALRTAIEAFVAAIDSPSGVQDIKYVFTNSSDGVGDAQVEVTLFINNTDVLESDFLKQVHTIVENTECQAVASTDECSLGIDNCDSSRSCVDSAYGFCCYHDMNYTASLVVNATYNATLFSNISSTDAQNLCGEVERIIQTQLDLKENRGCTQSIQFDCQHLYAGSVEAVLRLQIINATYTITDIADELKKAINSTTSFGTVIGAGDFDECSANYETERNCSAFAQCINFAGGFTCDCNTTHYDNGTVPGKICITPVTVNCSSSNISVSVLSDYYVRQGINLTSLHLADENCSRATHADIVGDSIEFTLAVNDCNTTLSTSADNSTVIASNFISNLPSSGVFTGTSIVIPFECKFPAALNITGLFNGQVATVNLPNVASTGGFTLDFSLYNGNFTNAISSGSTFLSNEIVYGMIRVVDSISDVSVKMDRCWGTPTSNRNDPEFFEFLTGGCSNGQATAFTIVSNGNGTAKFSMQMFFFTQVNAVYLHCDAVVCTPSCVTNCAKRRRRETAQQTQEVTVTFKLLLDPNDPQFNSGKGAGSIFGITSQDGSSANGSSDGSGSSEPNVQDIALPIVAAILAFVLIVLLALLVIVVVRKRRASKDNYDMTHVNMHAIGIKPPEY